MPFKPPNKCLHSTVCRPVAPLPALQTGPHFRRLNDAVVQLLDDFAMVTFTVSGVECMCGWMV